MWDDRTCANERHEIKQWINQKKGEGSACLKSLPRQTTHQVFNSTILQNETGEKGSNISPQI